MYIFSVLSNYIQSALLRTDGSSTLKLNITRRMRVRVKSAKNIRYTKITEQDAGRSMKRTIKNITTLKILFLALTGRRLQCYLEQKNLKKVIFSRRLVAFNGSSVPIGDESSETAFSAVWHEGVAGRKREDLTTVFFQYHTCTKAGPYSAL